MTHFDKYCLSLEWILPKYVGLFEGVEDHESIGLLIFCFKDALHVSGASGAHTSPPTRRKIVAICNADAPETTNTFNFHLIRHAVRLCWRFKELPILYDPV